VHAKASGVSMEASQRLETPQTVEVQRGALHPCAAWHHLTPPTTTVEVVTAEPNKKKIGMTFKAEQKKVRRHRRGITGAAARALTPRRGTVLPGHRRAGGYLRRRGQARCLPGPTQGREVRR
jgi:hypothetical protein